jgi:hypothetical protein
MSDEKYEWLVPAEWWVGSPTQEIECDLREDCGLTGIHCHVDDQIYLSREELEAVWPGGLVPRPHVRDDDFEGYLKAVDRSIVVNMTVPPGGFATGGYVGPGPGVPPPGSLNINPIPLPEIKPGDVIFKDGKPIGIATGAVSSGGLVDVQITSPGRSANWSSPLSDPIRDIMTWGRRMLGNY